MATFVLVHGSNFGGWIWNRVTPLLRAAGHEVYTPTLSGLSDRSHLLHCGINLSTHIADVSNLIVYQDLAEVILVGNSYAGMVITGVAAAVPERLKMLVYLDAYIPEDGQCETDLWPAERKAAAAEVTKDGLIPPPPTTIFGITDPELLKWIDERVTPHPASTYAEPVPAGNTRSRALPGTFIRCTGYPSTIANVFEQFVAKSRQRGWAVHELPTGHLAMVSAPQELAQLLLDISIVAD